MNWKFLSLGLFLSLPLNLSAIPPTEPELPNIEIMIEKLDPMEFTIELDLSDIEVIDTVVFPDGDQQEFGFFDLSETPSVDLKPSETRSVFIEWAVAQEMEFHGIPEDEVAENWFRQRVTAAVDNGEIDPSEHVSTTVAFVREGKLYIAKGINLGIVRSDSAHEIWKAPENQVNLEAVIDFEESVQRATAQFHATRTVEISQLENWIERHGGVERLSDLELRNFWNETMGIDPEFSPEEEKLLAALKARVEAGEARLKEMFDAIPRLKIKGNQLRTDTGNVISDDFDLTKLLVPANKGQIRYITLEKLLLEGLDQMKFFHLDDMEFIEPGDIHEDLEAIDSMSQVDGSGAMFESRLEALYGLQTKDFAPAQSPVCLQLYCL